MSSPIKSSFKTEWFSVAIIGLAFLAGLYFVSRLPALVPTHWNLAGQPNGYSTPYAAAFLLPLLMLIIYLVLVFLPYIDPKKDQYASFAPVYHHFKDLIIFFLFIIYMLTNLSGVGYKISIAFWTPLLVGGLFVIIGALLNKVKMNWFMGIRTPWTMSSETVWAKTHQLSSRVLMIAGLIIALTVMAPAAWKNAMFILAVAIVVLALPIYSYFLYAREKKEKK